MRYGVGFLLGAILIFSSGCGVHSHRRMGTAVDHRDVISRASFSEPMPGRYAHLTIARTVIGETPAVEEGTEELNEEYSFPVEAFDETLAEVLRQTGAFETVTVLGEDGDSEEPPDLGLLLQVELETQSVAFIKRNSNMAVGLGIWLTGIGFPAQWVHDEVYRVEFQGTAAILDYSTDELLGTVPLEECMVEEALNFHERTSSVVPYLLTNLIPPTVIGSDPASVVETLLPVAISETLVQMRDAFEGIAESFPPDGIRIWDPESGAVTFEFENPKKLAVVQGETVDLDLGLTLSRGTSDLIRVTVNGEVVIDAKSDSESIPEGNSLRVEKPGVEFQDGQITVSVLLHSEGDPVEVIYIRP